MLRAIAGHPTRLDLLPITYKLLEQASVLIVDVIHLLLTEEAVLSSRPANRFSQIDSPFRAAPESPSAASCSRSTAHVLYVPFAPRIPRHVGLCERLVLAFAAQAP